MSRQIILSLLPGTVPEELKNKGVVQASFIKELNALLRVDAPPTWYERGVMANTVARMAADECRKLGTRRVLLGSVPWLLAEFESACIAHELTPCYEFKKREVEYVTSGSGHKYKRQRFVHNGFLEKGV